MAEEFMTVKVDTSSLMEELRRMAASGEIHIALCGHLECAEHIKGFTLDKRKYRMRLEDETEDSVRVIIELKE